MEKKDCPTCNFPLPNPYACPVCGWVTDNKKLLGDMVTEYYELRELKEYLRKNLHWEEDAVIIRELCHKLGIR